MAALVIKEVARTRAIITIIIKIYMKQKFFHWACATPAPRLHHACTTPAPRLHHACTTFCIIITWPLWPLFPLFPLLPIWPLWPLWPLLPCCPSSKAKDDQESKCSNKNNNKSRCLYSFLNDLLGSSVR
jgi:hypothetical protein